MITLLNGLLEVEYKSDYQKLRREEEELMDKGRSVEAVTASAQLDDCR